MLQAGAIWKLWSLSASIALGMLSIGDLAEATSSLGQENLVTKRRLGDNAVHRRRSQSDADQVSMSVQCGNSFNNQDSTSTMPDNTVACMAYGDRPFFCAADTCQIRDDKNFQLAAPIHWKKFTFEQCLFPTGHNEPPDQDPKTVHPIQFWARNTKGTIWVNGWHDAQDEHHIQLFKCQWKNVGNRNNQRPWCDNCKVHKFTQRPVPRGLGP